MSLYEDVKLESLNSSVIIIKLFCGNKVVKNQQEKKA